MLMAAVNQFGKKTDYVFKILFLHHEYSSISGHNPMAGTESCTIEMAEYLQKQGVHVTIAGILCEGESYRHKGVKYFHLGKDYDLDSHLPLLGKENFDLVQVLRGGCLHKVAEHFPGAKTIVRLGDVFFSTHKTSTLVINKLADNVIAVSSFVKDRAIKWGIKADKITVIPIGIRTDIFRRLPEIYREKNLLVFVGATIREKGIYLLLKSFTGIPTYVPDAKLEIYGAASLWGRKELIPWMKVEQKFPNIIYKGVKFKEELTKALNRSALCIIPSLVPEGFGRVSLEAQACGCPVVCNAIGGLPETLIEGETGYVVNHMTHKNLATTIIDLLLDTNRLQSMSIKAAEYAQKFPVKNAAHDFMKMLI